MAPFNLNERQRNLVHALVPVLTSGAIGRYWHLTLDSERNITIDDHKHKVDFADLGWDSVTENDIVMLNHAGFLIGITIKEDGTEAEFLLNEQLIRYAEENNFEMPPIGQSEIANPSTHYEVRESIFVGGSVHVGPASFSHSTQKINNSTTLEPGFGEQFSTLLKRLDAELIAVDPEHGDLARSVYKQAQRLNEDIHEPTPDKDDIESSAGRLQKAADNIKNVAPTVFSIAVELVRMAISLQR